MQSEAVECGLASLAMIASAHGLHIGLPELRRRFPRPRSRARDSTRLMRIAQQLGFHTRALRLEIDDLPALALPCILHWDHSTTSWCW